MSKDNLTIIIRDQYGFFYNKTLLENFLTDDNELYIDKIEYIKGFIFIDYSRYEFDYLPQILADKIIYWIYKGELSTFEGETLFQIFFNREQISIFEELKFENDLVSIDKKMGKLIKEKSKEIDRLKKSLKYDKSNLKKTEKELCELEIGEIKK